MSGEPFLAFVYLNVCFRYHGFKKCSDCISSFGKVSWESGNNSYSFATIVLQFQRIAYVKPSAVDENTLKIVLVAVRCTHEAQSYQLSASPQSKCRRANAG